MQKHPHAQPIYTIHMYIIHPCTCRHTPCTYSQHTPAHNTYDMYIYVAYPHTSSYPTQVHVHYTHLNPHTCPEAQTRLAHVHSHATMRQHIPQDMVGVGSHFIGVCVEGAQGLGGSLSLSWSQGQVDAGVSWPQGCGCHWSLCASMADYAPPH